MRDRLIALIRLFRCRLLGLDLFGADEEPRGPDAKPLGKHNQKVVAGVESPGLQRLDTCLLDARRSREFLCAHALLLSELAYSLTQEEQVLLSLSAL